MVALATREVGLHFVMSILFVGIVEHFLLLNLISCNDSRYIKSGRGGRGHYSKFVQGSLPPCSQTYSGMVP
jgi:hypothetical protein